LRVQNVLTERSWPVNCVTLTVDLQIRIRKQVRSKTGYNFKQNLPLHISKWPVSNLWVRFRRKYTHTHTHTQSNQLLGTGQKNI